MIKKFRAALMAVTCLVTITACDVVQQLASVIAPNEFEMASGLRQALQQGLFKSFDAYSNPSTNPALAFIFPKDAQKIINLANQAGLGDVVNKTTTKFNTAVAQSFTAAKPIFLDAVKNMNIKDVANLLITQNQRAATDYFKTSTNTALMNAFRPIVDSTIKLEGADKEWKKIANVVNNIPFTNLKVENSLTDFVAARAIDGMFSLIAEEEKKIRTDINARKTDVMQRVFGYADQELKRRAGGAGTGTGVGGF